MPDSAPLTLNHPVLCARELCPVEMRRRSLRAAIAAAGIKDVTCYAYTCVLCNAARSWEIKEDGRERVIVGNAVRSTTA